MNRNHIFPRLGNRIIKSSIGVLICYIIYLLRDRHGIPFYSMLSVLWCIQPYRDKSMLMAFQRIAGTFIGAFYGFITIMIQIYLFRIYETPAGYFMIAAMIIPVLYTTVVTKHRNASYFSCVVYLSITVIHMADANPLMFVADRMLDTFIGIITGVLVNSAGLPRKKIRTSLFITELDDMLSPFTEELEPYSKVELNRMIDDGLRFTVITMRTPASLMHPLSGVHMNMPAVVMNGAALYDLKENRYLKIFPLPWSLSERLTHIIESYGTCCFINALYDENLIIYYSNLNNETEKSIYKSLRSSPYRNYARLRPSPENDIIYLMAVDRTEKTDMIIREINDSNLSGLIQIQYYPSDDYPGYSYIKIYSREASAEKMVEHIMNENQINKSVYIGSHSSSMIHPEGRSLNRVVRTLKKNFEPVSIKK